MAAAAAVATAGTARADDTFDSLAEGAVPLAPDRLADLFWSQLGTCPDGDDLERRACEGVRAARSERVARATYMIEADGALAVGPFDDRALSVDLVVRGCVACGEGVSIGGERRLLVGPGAVHVVGGRVRPAAVAGATRTFAGAAEGAAWIEEVAPRLRTQLLVRVPARPEPWSAGGASGYRLEIVGARVLDPCSGEVAAARPAAAAQPPDQRACEGAAVRRVLPVRLRRAEVVAALAPARQAAQRCFETFGVAGVAPVRIAVRADGGVEQAAADGLFAGTPTGACLERAVRAIRFPATQRPRTRIRYPFVLR